jgi:hypothetical protein
MKNYREEAKNYLESLNREDLQALLVDAGFEVEDGEGQVIYTEQLEAEVNFTIKGQLVAQYEYNFQMPRQVSISYPRAC